MENQRPQTIVGITHINSVNARYMSAPKRRIRGISQTIPDQSMSLRDIITRFSKGLPITGNPQPGTYNEEPSSGIDFRTLDLHEQMEVVRGYKEELTAIKTRQAESDAKLKREAIKNEIKAEFEAEMAKQKDPKTLLPENQQVV